MVVGKLTQWRTVNILKSMPPIYVSVLNITVEEVLRGDVKVGAQLELRHSAKQQWSPEFPVGKRVLVTVKFGGGDRVHSIALATDVALAAARESAINAAMARAAEVADPNSPRNQIEALEALIASDHQALDGARRLLSSLKEARDVLLPEKLEEIRDLENELTKPENHGDAPEALELRSRVEEARSGANELEDFLRKFPLLENEGRFEKKLKRVATRLEKNEDKLQELYAKHPGVLRERERERERERAARDIGPDPVDQGKPAN